MIMRSFTLFIHRKLNNCDRRNWKSTSNYELSTATTWDRCRAFRFNVVQIVDTAATSIQFDQIGAALVVNPIRPAVCADEVVEADGTAIRVFIPVTIYITTTIQIGQIILLTKNRLRGPNITNGVGAMAGVVATGQNLTSIRNMRRERHLIVGQLLVSQMDESPASNRLHSVENVMS